MRKLGWLGTILSMGLILTAASVKKPDFSGEWKLNVQKSKMQTMRVDSGTVTIIHQEPRFRFSRTFVVEGHEDTFYFELTTDGQENVSESEGGKQNSKLYWEGNTLVFFTRFVMPDREPTNTVRYSLRDNGKTFVVDEKFRGPILQYDNLWVFDKVK